MRPCLFFMSLAFVRPPEVRRAVPWKTCARLPIVCWIGMVLSIKKKFHPKPIVRSSMLCAVSGLGRLRRRVSFFCVAFVNETLADRLGGGLTAMRRSSMSGSCVMNRGGKNLNVLPLSEMARNSLMDSVPPKAFSISRGGAGTMKSWNVRSSGCDTSRMPSRRWSPQHKGERVSWPKRAGRVQFSRLHVAWL